MRDTSGPLIVRGAPAAARPSAVRPGLHSHNRTRRMPGATPRPANWLTRLRLLLLILGICSVGYYGYSLSDQYVYQAYENWAFDQQITGRKVAFVDYVREQTPFGFLVGTKGTEPPAVVAPAGPAEGALLGRVEISRLNLSAMVREGVDAKTLSLAVGHVPSTALPGQPGNFAIAAHRDTLFRALKDIKKDDLVTFESPTGTYTYQVVATQIVKPSEVSVLRPDGGGLVANPQKLLTMITCYPFYYIGSAPKRFIVEAKLVPDTRTATTDAQNTGPPAKAFNPRPVKQAAAKEPRIKRGSSHVSSPPLKPKKHGFWHKLLHL